MRYLIQIAAFILFFGVLGAVVSGCKALVQRYMPEGRVKRALLS